MNTHLAIDARSLAMDRLIAQKLRQNPLILQKARQVLTKWLADCDPSVRPTLEEWQSVLLGPMTGVLALLEGHDEKSVRLRQSSPFCGILTPSERTAILLAHSHEQTAA